MVAGGAERKTIAHVYGILETEVSQLRANLEDAIDAEHGLDSALEFLFRREAYLCLRFPTAGVAYEDLKFSALGLTGVLGKAVQGMPKDFQGVTEFVAGLFAAHNAPLGEKQKVEVPHYGAVNARGTSKWCAVHRKEVNRAASANWGVCSAGEVLDAHVNATRNMARLYFEKFPEKATAKGPGPPKVLGIYIGPYFF